MSYLNESAALYAALLDGCRDARTALEHDVQVLRANLEIALHENERLRALLTPPTAPDSPLQRAFEVPPPGPARHECGCMICVSERRNG